MKPEHLKFISLNGDEERQAAYLVAQAIRKLDELRRSAHANEDSRQLALEWYQSASRVLSSNVLGAENPSRFLELVVKALDGKPSKFDLKPIGEQIIQAWSAAYRLKAKTKTGRDVSVTPPLSEVTAITGPGFDVSLTPTLIEVKTQYAVLSGRKPPPPVDRAKLRHWVAELERHKCIPSDQTFRNTLELVKLPYKKDNRSRVTS
jgi:hypothetical protein